MHVEVVDASFMSQRLFIEALRIRLDEAVAFVWPSCGARRMAQTAAHGVDPVIRHVPMRQWGLSSPIPLRLLLAAQPQLLRPVLQFTRRVLTCFLLEQAGLKADRADSGAVTVLRNAHPALRCVVATRSRLDPASEGFARRLLEECLNRGLPVYAEGLMLLQEAAAVLRPTDCSDAEASVFATIERLVASNV